VWDADQPESYSTPDRVAADAHAARALRTADQLWTYACMGADLLRYRRSRCRWQPGLLQENDDDWARVESVLFGEPRRAA
jgi:hypothetical protein